MASIVAPVVLPLSSGALQTVHHLVWLLTIGGVRPVAFPKGQAGEAAQLPQHPVPCGLLSLRWYCGCSDTRTS
jgi:hypothetical protein